MKRKIAGWMGLLLAPVLTAIVAGAGVWAESGQDGADREVNVVFTHDLHSHLNPFYLEKDGEEETAGGFARMKTYLDKKRAEEGELLFLDGGDFSMGTLFQTVFETQAAELRMLGYLGADATTLGNHEFDYRSQGLANMLTAARDSGDTLPEILVCNVDWEASLASEQAQDCEILKKSFDYFGIKPYSILKKGDVTIAVTGVFGKDALACAPTCALTFRDPVEAVKDTVEEIKEKENPDMIVCVSHSGTWEDKSKSEDELLAKGVPDLDLIISGHTHSILSEPIVYGDTYIVSTGEYGARIGSLKLTENGKGRWALTDYELTLLDHSHPADVDTQEKIDALGNTIDSEYLARFGFTKEQVLAYNPWQFAKVNGLGEVLQEEPLGNLLADAYLYAVNQTDDGEEPAAVAVVPSGCIRDTFHKDTEITVADAFQALSLGIGPDGVPGYPLVSVYLTGEELRTMAEVDASVSPMMTTAQLYTSGLSYTLNPNRMILNKVTEIKLKNRLGETEELQDDKLYRVVADLYTGQMLGAVNEQSFGILSITPKDSEGNEITIEDLEDHLVYRQGQELKAWVCAAEYLQSFEKAADGVPVIPDYYSASQGRKIVDDDGSIVAIVKNPNRTAVAIICIAAGAILLLSILIALTVRLVRRIKRKNSNDRKM